jgi:hypothetical protein
MDLWNYTDRRTEERKTGNVRDKCLYCFLKLLLLRMEWKNYSSSSAAANFFGLNNRT